MFPQPHTSFLPLLFKGTSRSTSRQTSNRASSIAISAGMAEVAAVKVGSRAMPGEDEDGVN